MNSRSKSLSGLVFPTSKELFQFRKHKKNHIGQDLGTTGGEAKTVTFSFFQNAVSISEARAGTLPCRRRICLKSVTGRRF